MMPERNRHGKLTLPFEGLTLLLLQLVQLLLVAVMVHKVHTTLATSFRKVMRRLGILKTSQA